MKRARAKLPDSLPVAGSGHTDKLVELIDHCTAAKKIADEMGETFLAYLIAMAIQEGRTAMRHLPSTRQSKSS